VAAIDARQPDFPVVFANAAFARLTGYDEAAQQGRSWPLLPNNAAALLPLVKDGQAADVVLEVQHKNNGILPLPFSIMPISDPIGLIAFVLLVQASVPPPFAVVPDQPGSMDAGDTLRLMLSISGAAASWVWDIQTSLIHGDLRFSQLYGLTPNQAAKGVSPKVFYSIIHPQDQTRIRLAVGGLLRGAEVFSKEYRLLLRDGSLRWVHAKGRCQYDDEKPIRFIGALVDITEQKRVEERLRIAQAAGGIGTFEYVLGYGTVSVSPQFCSLLGLRPSGDLPVYAINAVVVPGDGALIDAVPPELGRASHVQLRIRRSDTGELRWLVRQGEYFAEEGADPRFSGAIYDITDAKAVEDELRQLSETLEARVEERTRERDRVWQLSRDLYIVCDADGSCLGVNPAWENELGLSAKLMLGRRFTDFVLLEDRAPLSDAIGRALAGQAVENLDLRISAAKGGIRTFSWTCVHEGRSVIAAGRDVTQRNELEERLRQSQKMEAVGQLTGGLAHDFNNLLAGIAGSLELLRIRMQQGRTAELDRFITAAQQSASRAAALTHRLLAFSRRQTLDPKPTDVAHLTAGMSDLITRTVGPAITMETKRAPDLWSTLVDPNQLENALLNLCINARDAMPDGGSIMIEAENVSLEAWQAAARDMPPGQYVSLSVTDTGTGMPPDVAERAFDPFFTTKPIGQGTGLGLSMIYGFVRQSGGQVRIHSEVSRGTTVRLYLPRHLGVAELVHAESSADAALRAELGETVLVVDDEASVRMLVVEVLRDLGYSAIEAVDGLSGLEILRSSARVDLLVSDVGLPGGMNGRQLADAGCALRPDLKVLFITGYAESAVMETHLTPGMSVLTKPFSLEILAGKIRGLISAQPEA
jgi:PAS domain S-box-containing protein